MAQWRQETILKLIGAYRARKLLWDHNAPDYTDRSKRIHAWKEIADELGCDVMTVERKLKSLKTHFMSVHKAYAKRRLKADLNPGSIVIKPKWFAYEALAFLNKGRLMRINRETSNVEKQNSMPVSNWKPQEISSYRDEFTVFAEHVAIRLKNITDVRARLVAQHQINNILFEAEMGKYNIHSSFNMINSEITENLDEPSTSNEEKVMINV
ncbi:MADF domain-containing protein [Camponotus japonicus]